MKVRIKKPLALIGAMIGLAFFVAGIGAFAMSVAYSALWFYFEVIAGIDMASSSMQKIPLTVFLEFLLPFFASGIIGYQIMIRSWLIYYKEWCRD